MKPIGFVTDGNAEKTIEALIHRVERLERLFLSHFHTGPVDAPSIPASMKMEEDNAN